MSTNRAWTAAHRRFSVRSLACAGCACFASSVLSACGPATVDHTPAGNILDADTQSLESGTGHWQSWYSTDITRTTDGARRGRASLHIEVTELYGWGVQLDNWPGFPAAPGRHRAELWARAVAGSALELLVTVHWRGNSGDDIQKDDLRLRLDRTWRKVGQDVTAPPGTERVWIELTGGDGDPGDAIQVDEIFVL
jgi:hypothetical protein